ncbi:hypothetical protein GH714_026854 [Hevea brasiliensis]|uniref:Alpha/beta hydrolase fold-3 domain-containing protein n=1 Tax=Hevea brasiliensis TaxID=3981 RepID=A0A6A6NJH5_HEVBR|nr:hypothetical protein GH714_026854 [Hevea brasiliensis]
MWGIGVTAAMVITEFTEVGISIILKAAMTRGLSQFVYIVYSNALAIPILLPSSFILYRKRPLPQLTVSILFRIFLLALVSCAVQLFMFTGMRYSSPVLSTAMNDLTPAFTFLLAIISSMEKLDFRLQGSQAKSIGTILSVAGALIVTLYKGQPLTGSFSASLRNVVHTWACGEKGPLYTAMFKPLGMIIAIFLGISFLGDTLYLGSVIGGIVIALGFYTVIWEKPKKKKGWVKRKEFPNLSQTLIKSLSWKTEVWMCSILALYINNMSRYLITRRDGKAGLAKQKQSGQIYWHHGIDHRGISPDFIQRLPITGSPSSGNKLQNELLLLLHQIGPLETWIIRDYPSEILITLISCIFVTILSATVSLIAEEDPNAWRIRPNIELVAIGYSAAFAVSLRSIVHTWACHKKGPVYTSMFKPIGMVIAVLMGVSFLDDTLYLGSMIEVIIALGFYAVALILKKFTAVLTIMFYLCFFGTMLSALYSLIVVEDSGAWQLKLDMGLFSTSYSAVVSIVFRSSFCAWCLSKTGPVYVSVFKSLGIIFALIMDVIFLGEVLRLGIFIGASITVTGFYAVMWGKAKEDDYMNSETADNEVAHEFRFFRVYKDGRIHMFMPTCETIPPFDDPASGVQSKDVTISTQPSVSVRIFLPNSKTLIRNSLFILHSWRVRSLPNPTIPACYEDSWAALQWAASHVNRNGPEQWLNDHADFAQVFIGGDSAGGNISHTLAFRVGTIGLPAGVKVVGLILVHPYFGGTEDEMWLYMCPDNRGLDDPRMNPSVEDIGGLGVREC